MGRPIPIQPIPMPPPLEVGTTAIAELEYDAYALFYRRRTMTPGDLVLCYTAEWLAESSLPDLAHPVHLVTEVFATVCVLTAALDDMSLREASDRVPFCWPDVGWPDHPLLVEITDEEMRILNEMRPGGGMIGRLHLIAREATRYPRVLTDVDKIAMAQVVNALMEICTPLLQATRELSVALEEMSRALPH